MNLNLTRIMDYTVKLNVLVIAFVLVFTLSIVDGKSVSGKKSNCSNVVCQDPPENSNCKVADKDDNVPKPKGKEGHCCPVYKCEDPTPQPPPQPAKTLPSFAQMMNFPSFFTFNGFSKSNAKSDEKPDTETVSYKNTNPSSSSSSGGGNFFNFVNSVATGNHNAMSFASNSMMSPEQIMKAMEAAF